MKTSLPAIVPAPRQMTPTGGAILLNAPLRIVCDQAAHAEGLGLVERLCQVGFPAVLCASWEPQREPHLDLRLDPSCRDLGAEGYRLSVTAQGIRIRAADRPGLFYGAQTLRQLLPPDLFDLGGSLVVPCVEIEDSPRFRWRGAMLDVARHFLPKSFVLKFIDLLALHKMNVLHLHLTDDQGWRLEIKKYPRLTAVGSVRRATLVGRALANPADAGFDPASQRLDGVPHAGLYTQEEAREIVAYAATRHVMVVPEIEMPGHAQAAIAAYPFFGCGEEPLEVSPRWGIHDAIFKPNERTLSFLRDVLEEVISLFPSPYLHVGGDEAIKTRWLSDPECRALRQALELPDEEAMQAHVIRRIGEFLAGRGRTLVGWDEILEGGLSPGAVVMSWRDEAGGVAAACQGHDVVMTPQQYTYLDHYQGEDWGAEPLAFSETLRLPTVYGYEPIPEGLPPDRARHVLGAQAQLWSEYMPTPDQVEYQAFPRLAALAEVTWSPRAARDYPDFLRRLRRHLPRLDALGVRYRPLEAARERVAAT